MSEVKIYKQVEQANETKINFDFLEDTEISLTKSVQETSILGGIKEDGVLNFSLPFTRFNSSQFRSFRRFSIIDNDLAPIPVRTQYASSILPEDQLYALSTNEGDRSYETELFRGESYWVSALKNCYLRDLDLGTFTFDQPTIDNNRQLNDSYSGSNDIVYFGDVHYGGWITAGTSSYEDLRPLFSYLGLLEKMFCKAGYTLESPYLESTIGRRKWLYILKKDYFDHSTAGNLVSFRASVPSDYIDTNIVGTRKIQFTDDTTAPNFDNGNNYDTTTYEYTNPSSTDIEMEIFGAGQIEVDASESTTNENVTIWVRLENSLGIGGIFSTKTELGGSTVTLDYNISQVLNVPTGSVLYLEFSAYKEDIVSGQTVQVDATVKAGSYFGATVASKQLYLGDTLQLSEMVNQDLKCYDLLDAIIHEHNFKIETDELTRTVTLHIPEEKDITSTAVDTIEGFYLPKAQKEDITSKIICNSLISNTPRQKPARFIRLQFADSNDAYIDSLNLPDDQPLWSRTLDFGSGLTEETEIRSNPLIQPTADYLAEDLTPPNESPISIPAMWDNDDGNRSFDIGVRGLIALGAVTQFFGDSTTGTPREYRFNGSATVRVAYVTQSPQVDSSSTLPMSVNNIFASKDEDLFNLFYKEEMLQLKQSGSIDFLAMLSYMDYRQYNFRKPFFINYMGDPFYCRLQTIRDFIVGGGLATPITVIPDRNRTDDCITQLCDLNYTSFDPTGSTLFLYDSNGNIQNGSNNYSEAEAAQLQADIEALLDAGGYVYESVIIEFSTIGSMQINNVIITQTNAPITVIQIDYEDFGAAVESVTNCVTVGL